MTLKIRKHSLTNYCKRYRRNTILAELQLTATAVGYIYSYESHIKLVFCNEIECSLPASCGIKKMRDH